MLEYTWTILEKPTSSEATLIDNSIVNPSFIADVHGEYSISLIVIDPWSSSEEDIVIVSFENIVPLADAGPNQAVFVGDIVYLDGSGSSDANGDPLTHKWSFISKPQGSNANLSSPENIQTTFEADLAGEYIISLITNDGFIDSDPSIVTMYAAELKDNLIKISQELIDT